MASEKEGWAEADRRYLQVIACMWHRGTTGTDDRESYVNMAFDRAEGSLSARRKETSNESPHVTLPCHSVQQSSTFYWSCSKCPVMMSRDGVT